MRRPAGDGPRRLSVLVPQCTKEAEPEAESSRESGTGGQGGLNR